MDRSKHFRIVLGVHDIKQECHGSWEQLTPLGDVTTIVLVVNRLTVDVYVTAIAVTLTSLYNG